MTEGEIAGRTGKNVILTYLTFDMVSLVRVNSRVANQIDASFCLRDDIAGVRRSRRLGLSANHEMSDRFS